MVDNSEIKIELIKVSNLYEFACKTIDCHKKGEIIPITKQRAFAQEKNPCADVNDVGLIVAFYNDQCVGYLGLVPGILRIVKEFHKVYYASSLFVSSELRKRKLGTKILQAACDLNYDLVFSGMGKAAEKLYRSLNFLECKTYYHHISNLRKCRIEYILLKVFNKSRIMLKVASKIDDLIYPSVRRITYKFQAFIAKQSKHKITQKEIEQIREDSKNDKFSSSVEFYRDERVINWMLKYKWISENKNDEILNRDYYFSSFRDTFMYKAIEIYSKNDGKYCGFLIFAFSAEASCLTLKILDYSFSMSEYLKYIPSIVLEYSGRYDVDKIDIPDSLSQYFKKIFLFNCTIQKVGRLTLCHPRDTKSPLAVSIKKIKVSHCDGDIPFY